jgi:hypothetical protein
MPIFCANLAFTYSFRDTRSADMAFASNLLGAILGGILKGSALIIGYRSQVLIAAGLYLLAYLLATRWRSLADRDPMRGVAGVTDGSALDQRGPRRPGPPRRANARATFFSFGCRISATVVHYRWPPKTPSPRRILADDLTLACRPIRLAR